MVRVAQVASVAGLVLRPFEQFYSIGPHVWWGSHDEVESRYSQPQLVSLKIKLPFRVRPGKWSSDRVLLPTLHPFGLKLGNFKSSSHLQLLPIGHGGIWCHA